MFKCEVIKNFSLNRFDELIDIERKTINQYGKLYEGDRFKCNKEMVEYLTGKNEKCANVVKIIEIIPESKI